TLTENRQRVRVLASGTTEWVVEGDDDAAPVAVQRLLEFAVLAAKRSAFDPLDAALNDLADRVLADSGRLHREWNLLREFGLTSERPLVARLWQRAREPGVVVAAKGAPEAI